MQVPLEKCPYVVVGIVFAQDEWILIEDVRLRPCLSYPNLLNEFEFYIGKNIT
jgi:hypothetical protein